jgi:hypothetical protein
MKKVVFSLLCFAIFSLFGSANATIIGDEDGDIVGVTDDNLHVMLSDQTTPPLIVNMSSTSNTTTLTVATSIGDSTITVAAATGLVDGAMITIADPVSGRYYLGHQVGAIAGLVVTVDTPLDYAYPIASAEVSIGSHNLNVSGTIATPKIFSVRAGEQSDVPTTIDVTRIIITCVDTTPISMSGFCGGAALTNGLVLRSVDGTTQNIFNIKTNQDLMNLAYDFTPQLVAGNPPGYDGFVSRLTFAGQNKMGVAIRLGPGEDLEMIIQDDLTGLTSLFVIAEGHVVID